MLIGASPNPRLGWRPRGLRLQIRLPISRARQRFLRRGLEQSPDDNDNEHNATWMRQTKEASQHGIGTKSFYEDNQRRLCAGQFGSRRL
jgi:hypothetical protein